MIDLKKNKEVDGIISLLDTMEEIKLFDEWYEGNKDKYKDIISYLLSKAIENGLPEEYMSSFKFCIWSNKSNVDSDDFFDYLKPNRAYGTYCELNRNQNGSNREIEFVNKDITIPYPDACDVDIIKRISLSIYNGHKICTYDETSNKVYIWIVIHDFIDEYSKELSKKFSMDRQEFNNFAKQLRNVL